MIQNIHSLLIHAFVVRYYDAKNGRFISEYAYAGNQKETTELNRYTYGRNNPIKYLDPRGNMAMTATYVASTVAPLILDGLVAIATCVLTVVVFDSTIEVVENNVARKKQEKAKKESSGFIKNLENKLNNVKKVVEGSKEKGKTGKGKDKGEAKPSNKPYKNNKEANKQAQKQGYKDAHELKEDYVGKSNVSKYDMKYDTKTGEIYLESKDGKTQIPTGLIHEP